MTVPEVEGVRLLLEATENNKQPNALEEAPLACIGTLYKGIV
jgi:hypothetical protein